MLFSSYQQLKRSKYFLYLVLDLAIAYGAYRYMTDFYTLFDWTFFIEIYLVILLIQFVFVMRDGIVNAMFLKFNERFLVEGIVSEFRALNYPTRIADIDSALDYFEAVIQDPGSNLPLKLSAAKYLNLLQAMQSGASGWINHYFYTKLLELSIHKHLRAGGSF
jgi:hypothetical protein